MDYNKPITYERFLELKKAGDCVFCGNDEISLNDVCDYDELGFATMEDGEKAWYLFCDVFEFSADDRKKMAEQSKKANIEFHNFVRQLFGQMKDNK